MDWWVYFIIATIAFLATTIGLLVGNPPALQPAPQGSNGCTCGPRYGVVLAIGAATVVVMSLIVEFIRYRDLKITEHAESGVSLAVGSAMGLALIVILIGLDPPGLRESSPCGCHVTFDTAAGFGLAAAIVVTVIIWAVARPSEKSS